MKEYVKKGREMFVAFKDTLTRAHSIKEAAEIRGYELYCYDTWFNQSGGNEEVEVSINLTAEATIAVRVGVNYITGKMRQFSECEIIDPETGDWDDEIYFFTED